MLNRFFENIRKLRLGLFFIAYFAMSLLALLFFFIKYHGIDQGMIGDAFIICLFFAIPSLGCAIGIAGAGTHLKSYLFYTYLIVIMLNIILGAFFAFALSTAGL